MAENAGPTVAVKLFIDKEKQKVLFAESDKEFVDVLFSFLTMPLGTIVRVLGKQSEVGCLDELYKSVENLSEDHFRAKACKTMLLSPINAAARDCEGLRVKVDDTDARAIYICTNSACTSYRSVPDSVCESIGCGATCFRQWPKTAQAVEDGVFVKGGQKFIITDDLQVAPASTSLVFSLLDKFGLHNQAIVEEKVLQINSTKMTSLLKRALISKQPLSGLYFDVAVTHDVVGVCQLPEFLLAKQSNDVGKFSAIKIKLVQTKDESAVLYAEVGQDFIDLVFGLLSIPLGSIVKAYGHWSPNGCVDNLYTSIGGYIKDERRNLLLSPKLAPYFSCSSNVLQVEELIPRSLLISCFRCLVKNYSYCTCKAPLNLNIYEGNPKPKAVYSSTSSQAQAYMKRGPRNYMVTDDLRILHFSLANSLQVLRAAKIPKEKLVEKELTLDKTQVLKLMKAAIITRYPLSTVLLPPKKKRHPRH